MLSKASIVKALLAASVLALAWPGVLRVSAAPDGESSPKSSELQLISNLLETAFDAYVDEDYDRAVTHFQRVLQLNPRDKTAQKGLKQSQKMLKNKNAIFQQNEKDRLKAARKFASKEKWLEALDEIASVLAVSANSREALEIQNEIAALCRERMSDAKAPPGNEMIYQGLIHYMNKRYEEAIKIWREAAALRPEDFKIVIYMERAEQTLRQGEKYETLVLGPKRAAAHFSTGNFEAAAEIWRKILQYQPDNKQAIEWLDKIKKESAGAGKETLIGELYDHGLELFQKEKYAESLAKWNGILEIDPNNEVAKGYVERIQAKGVTKAATTTPKDPAPPAPVTTIPTDESRRKEEAQMHYTRGSLNYAEGKLDEAIKEWREALRIYPAHAPSIKMLDKISGGKKP